MVPFLLATRLPCFDTSFLGCRGRRSSSQAGYSLIELVITVGMILVVTTWAMPSFLNYLRSARVQAGARAVSAYLNEGRQLAIKTNAPVCVAHTTSTLQFRSTNCAGRRSSSTGLAGASSSVRLPENISLSVTSGTSAVFQPLGNADGHEVHRDRRAERTDLEGHRRGLRPCLSRFRYRHCLPLGRPACGRSLRRSMD